MTRIARWLLMAIGLRRGHAQLFCGFFALIGTGLVVISFPIWATSVSFAHHGHQIDGIVTELTSTPNATGGGVDYYATVKYTVESRVYQGRIPVDWCSTLGFCQRKVGDRVAIVYDTRDPKQIEDAEGASSAWMVPAMLIPCGLLIAIPSLALFIGFTRVKGRRSTPDPL